MYHVLFHKYNLHVGAKDFKGKVARGFKERICDEEDHQCNGELIIRHVIRLQERVARARVENLCIS